MAFLFFWTFISSTLWNCHHPPPWCSSINLIFLRSQFWSNLLTLLRIPNLIFPSYSCHLFCFSGNNSISPHFRQIQLALHGPVYLVIFQRFFLSLSTLRTLTQTFIHKALLPSFSCKIQYKNEFFYSKVVDFPEIPNSNWAVQHTRIFVLFDAQNHNCINQ